MAGSVREPVGEELGVGVVGFGWMGEVHARAYARLPHHFPRLPRLPRLVAVADPLPDRAEAARWLGFERALPSWRDLLEDPLVEAVSVTTPNDLHREIGVMTARAGKHLWIEKPVGRNADETQAVAAPRAAAGVQ
ncbi:MAG TPA: Gfo/Idh/MocA family oxidoreductase, partial [Asanoa sp.]